MMKARSLAFTHIDLLAVLAAMATLLAIGLPALSRARELSKRMVCSTNLAGIGATAKIYAGENKGLWMIPAHKKTLVDTSQQVDYTCNEVNELSTNDSGCVGNQRPFQTFSDTPDQPAGGSTAVSTTRAFWLLVRSGRVNIEQFVCPSSNDFADPTADVNLYYDFNGYRNISYGYRVPFGPADTRPNENADSRIVFAADKSPFYVSSFPTWQDSDHQPLTLRDPIKDWQPYNSRNHGNYPYGEGQNCLYGDAHVSFQRTPTAGIDNDNIYTVIADEVWSDPFHKNIIHGDTVWTSPEENPYPGQNAFGTGPNKYAATDSLIYP